MAGFWGNSAAPANPGGLLAALAPPQAAPAASGNGLLDLLSGGAQRNANALIGLGTGLMTGNTFGNGLASGFQQFQQGLATDRQAAYGIGSISQTTAYLQQKYPDIAAAVQSRALTPAEGMQAAFQRQTPGYGTYDLAPGQERFDANNKLIASAAPKAPDGYVYTGPDNTSLQPLPGGPADPNNVLNSYRTGNLPGGTPGGKPPGTIGTSGIDPSIPGYTTAVVPGAGGLTQAAIDQAAISAAASGTKPAGGGRGGPGAAQAAAITNRMAEIDPSGNLAKNKVQLKSLSGSLGMQQKYLDTTTRAFNTANDTLANLQTYMVKNGINPSQYPDYNSFTNFLKAKGLDPGAAGGYNAQLQTLRSEYSQVLAKGGVRSVETDREAAQLIPDGLSPAQLAQVAAQIKIDGENAVNEAQKQVGAIGDQINGIVNPNAAAPAAGAQPAANTPTGNTTSTGVTWSIGP